MSSLDPRAPLVLDTRELGRRPGSQRELELSVPAPAELGIEVLAVPEGSPVELDLRLEAVMEGVLLTGTATAALEGECVRCLQQIEDEIHVTLQELYVYPDQHDKAAEHDDRDLDDETSRLEDDLLDLEPLLRDAVVLALPFQPLCMDDCPGLCTECGARLADDPDHAHDAPIDPRWAGLQQLRPDTAADPAPTSRTPRTELHRESPAEKQASHTLVGDHHGCSEAEDVAQQHASPPFAVEGRRADPRDVRQPRLRRQAPPAPRVRPVRPVRRQGRPSPGPLTTDELRAALGDPVLDPELLQRALTHRSFAYENGQIPTNERLEFLGDSVLGVVVTETLYRVHPDFSEGRLAKLRAAVVNARALADVARQIGLGQHIKLGRGEETTGGRDKASILSDTVEAVIGAIHLSGGIDEAAKVVHLLFDPVMEAAASMGAGLDWKTSLQELSADLGLGVPEYLIEDDGPDHMKTFVARVRVGEQVLGNGTGRSKKEAEQGAAETAYREIKAAHANGQPVPEAAPAPAVAPATATGPDA